MPRRPEDQAVYWKTYYKENRARLIEKAATRSKLDVARIRESLITAKDRPCADCNVKYAPWVMQFDHVPDRGSKTFTLSKAVRQKYSAKKIAEEIAKCDVVCANCHAERTYQRGIQRAGALPCKQSLAGSLPASSTMPDK